ncbi:MAG: hypothetical protein WCO89_10170 [Syntrophus sp. (in: bacteria)]
MRRVEIFQETAGGTIRKKMIESPWLRVEEAAAYCGISRTAFTQRAHRLPYGGDRIFKLYHINILDAFIEGRLPDAPFSPEGEPPKTPIRRSRTVTMSLTHPITGKICYPKGMEPKP